MLTNVDVCKRPTSHPTCRSTEVRANKNPWRERKRAWVPGRTLILFACVPFPFLKCVDRLPYEQTYVIATWKRKRQDAKTLTSGEGASWLVGRQEAGVPASVHTHPVLGGEENPSVMSEETKSPYEHLGKRIASPWLISPATAGPKLQRQPPSAAERCQPQRPVCSATPQAVVLGALELSQPFALPTMPFCVSRHHQNCPSAPTKIGASYSVRQPGQPVTATANRRLTCWEADTQRGFSPNRDAWAGTDAILFKVTKNKTPMLVRCQAWYHLGLRNIPLM